jgi:LmbE family N-acetylglucosaminyl deacetylase
MAVGFKWRFSFLDGIAIFILVALSAVNAVAQTPYDISIKPSPNALELNIDRGSAALWQSLLKLHTRASLIMVVAHPDDEDGGLLTYESRGKGARVSLLTLNRGEGGQNVMSDDYWDYLGQIRTQELLAADRYYGVEQYWSRVADYGFSKTKEEAYEKWDHDRVLYDVVRVVRMTRPLVVSSVFVGALTDGHGNHQVAGQMAQEVFKAAGDPSIFPDQIKEGLRPWSPLKVYGRMPFFSITEKGMFDYATGKWSPVRFYDYVNKSWIEGKPSVNLEVPTGDYDPLLGFSYVQVARDGLGHQKSQNGGTGIPAAGKVMSPYHRFGSLVPTADKESSLFDGVDVSLMGTASLAKDGDTAFLKAGLSQINKFVEDAMSRYSAQKTETVAPILAGGLKATNALIDQVTASSLSDDAKYDLNHELKLKQVQFRNAIVEALGLTMQAKVVSAGDGPDNGFSGPQDTFQAAIPGQQFLVNVHVTNQNSSPVKVQKVSLAASENENWSFEADKQPKDSLGSGQSVDVRFKVGVAANAAYTRPYFTRPDLERAYYDINDKRSINQPTSPYPLAAWVEFEYEGLPLRIGQVVQTLKKVTGQGVVMEPLVVAPAIAVAISPNAGIVPLTARTFELAASIHSNVKGPAKGTVSLQLPEGWHASPAKAEFSTVKDGEDQTIAFHITPGQMKEKAYTITAVASYGGQEYKDGYHTVGYTGLRPYNVYRAATYNASGLNVKVARGLNIGYIVGTGDEVPKSLENLGINVHFLSAQDISNGNLAKYDAILMGVRAYAAREELKTYNGRILNYVKNGGVVIVQYNTGEYDHNYGPAPYSLSRSPEKVVDENARVNILDPKNPVFTWPNQITSSDFNGWVEERGHGFMSTWDPQYQALVETHDPEQDPQKGGLLYARYGKGVYIYNAFAFYRQLPEGVSGTYRVFANLLSLARNPALLEKVQAGGSKSAK